MHRRRSTRRIGSVLVVTAFLATMVGTAGPAASASRADTRTSLTAAPSTSSAGQPVTLTATVSFNKSGTHTPTGLVYFGATNGNTSRYLGSAPVTGCSLVTRKCTATLVTTNIPNGRNAVGALYGGDNYFQVSAGLTGATVNASAPGAPTLNSATAGDGQVALQWSAPTSGGTVSTYSVFRSTTQGGSGSSIASGLTGTSYTDTAATNNSTYYYVVKASGPGGQSPASNELSAHPPSSAASTCSPAAPCASPEVTSSDGSTSLQVTADASTGSSTLTVQVGGLAAMFCSNPASGSVIAEYHTTAADAAKVAEYTVFGAAADYAFNFYAAHTDMSGCYGSPDPFNGYTPDEGGTWADGPWSYGSAVLDEGTGLYEAYLGSCANHSGYQPCFTNIGGDGSNTTEVHSPASPNDPRVSH